MSLYPKSHYNVLQWDGTLLWAWKFCRYSRIVVISAVVISELSLYPQSLLAKLTVYVVELGKGKQVLRERFLRKGSPRAGRGCVHVLVQVHAYPRDLDESNPSSFVRTGPGLVRRHSTACNSGEVK